MAAAEMSRPRRLLRSARSAYRVRMAASILASSGSTHASAWSPNASLRRLTRSRAVPWLTSPTRSSCRDRLTENSASSHWTPHVVPVDSWDPSAGGGSPRAVAGLHSARPMPRAQRSWYPNSAQTAAADIAGQPRRGRDPLGTCDPATTAAQSDHRRSQSASGRRHRASRLGAHHRIRNLAKIACSSQRFCAPQCQGSARACSKTLTVRNCLLW